MNKKENRSQKMFVQCEIDDLESEKIRPLPIRSNNEVGLADMDLGSKLETYLEIAVNSLHRMTEQVDIEKLENQHHLLCAALIMFYSIFEKTLCPLRPELADRDYGPRFMQTLRDLNLVSPNFEDFMSKFCEEKPDGSAARDKG